jgi:hypothetical protein
MDELAIAVWICVALGGSYSIGVSNARNDCVKRERFIIKDKIYQCVEIKTDDRK